MQQPNLKHLIECSKLNVKCFKIAKLAIFKPLYFPKMIKLVKYIFSKFELKKTILSFEPYKKFRSKLLVKNSKSVWRKPPRAQLFRHVLQKYSEQ